MFIMQHGRRHTLLPLLEEAFDDVRFHSGSFSFTAASMFAITDAA